MVLETCYNSHINSSQKREYMSDTYTTPFVFHCHPRDIFDLSDHFNFSFNPLDFQVTDTDALVYDLTFKSPTDLEKFTTYYNGDDTDY